MYLMLPLLWTVGCDQTPNEPVAVDPAIPNETATQDPLAIPEEDAKYLQDVEHFGGFVLGDLTFPKINLALSEQQWDTFASFFADHFEANVFDWKGGIEHQDSFGTFRIWDESQPLQTLNRLQFTAFIQQLREQFSELMRSEFKVMQMAPETRGEFEEPWRGSFKISMAGRTLDGSISELSLKFNCRISGITDETPEQTEFLLSASSFSAKQATAPDFLMTEITKQTGMTTLGLRDNWKYSYPEGETRPFLTGGIYAIDFNQDGLSDFLITDLDGLFFYVGQPGGTFLEQTIEVGLQRFIKETLAVVGDFNNDSFEDLIIGQSAYINEQGKRFRKLKTGEFEFDLAKRKGSMNVVDFDNDGLLDLMEVGIILKEELLPWINREESGSTLNRLWKNVGNFHFKDVTKHAQIGGLGTGAFSAVWFDANGDHHPDFMAACEFGKNDYYINNGDGTFTQTDLPDKHGGFSMGITVTDIDNDGFGDPYLANMYSKAGERIVANIRKGLYSTYGSDIEEQLQEFVSGNELYHNQGDGTFERIGRSVGVNDVGWAYGTGAADLNGDGYPEIYAPVGFQSVTKARPDG